MDEMREYVIKDYRNKCNTVYIRRKYDAYKDLPASLRDEAIDEVMRLPESIEAIDMTLFIADYIHYADDTPSWKEFADNVCILTFEEVFRTCMTDTDLMKRLGDFIEFKKGILTRLGFETVIARMREIYCKNID